MAALRSVRFTVSGLAVIRLGQQTVAVVRRIFVRGNGILGPILMPLPAKVIVRVIFEEELHIFLAIAAKYLDVVSGIGTQHQCFCSFSQRFSPEMRIELAVAEMICLFDEYTKQGKLLDYLPELCRQVLIVDRIRRRQ